MARHDSIPSLRLFTVATILFVVTSTASSVHAIEAGDYRCEVDSAIGVANDGSKVELGEAPRAFRLQAVNAPVMPDELRKPPRSLERYEPEERPIVSAAIDVRLFDRPATALRSRNGIVYSQGANVIVFSDDGAFVAYGIADKAVLRGVAIYSGKCIRL